MIRILLIAFLSALLGGCGQKGPLSLPQDKPAEAPAAQPAAPADDNSDTHHP